METQTRTRIRHEPRFSSEGSALDFDTKPPRCPRADVPHAWPRRERDVLTISYIRIPFHGLDMALLVWLFFFSQ
jgi:hypothetical protein